MNARFGWLSAICGVAMLMTGGAGASDQELGSLIQQVRNAPGRYGNPILRENLARTESYLKRRGYRLDYETKYTVDHSAGVLELQLAYSKILCEKGEKDCRNPAFEMAYLRIGALVSKEPQAGVNTVETIISLEITDGFRVPKLPSGTTSSGG